MGHTKGFRGRVFGDCRRSIMGCLGEEPKAGKGRVLGDL